MCLTPYALIYSSVFHLYLIKMYSLYNFKINRREYFIWKSFSVTTNSPSLNHYLFIYKFLGQSENKWWWINGGISFLDLCIIREFYIHSLDSSIIYLDLYLFCIFVRTFLKIIVMSGVSSINIIIIIIIIS